MNRTAISKTLRFARVFAAAIMFHVLPTISLGAERLPNIVLILADDLGYGDVEAYNPESKISTPNINRLAHQGMRLTDAHAAAWCVPSRYELLTGRYLFRTDREYQHQALIESGRPTLASLLKNAGYDTAMIGKWNLSFEGGVAFDYRKPLQGGPIDHGFNSYFGIPASLDFAPYFFIEDRHAVEAPTAHIDEHHTPGVRSIQGEFWREGAVAPGFRHEDVLPQLVDRAVRYLKSRSRSQQPFFLYLALAAPHAPWLPAKQFRGKSGAGMYGDFVMQVDDVVGQIDAALESAGKARDTLLIFTSDNGPTWYQEDVQKYDHRSAGNWRGMKADAWEGGHRIPFIARWSGKIPASASSAQLVSFTDMLATFASLTRQHLPENVGEDSLDMLPVLLGKHSKSIRSAIIHQAIGPGGNTLAIRQGNWKLIPWLGDKSIFEGFGYGASDQLTPLPPEAPKPQGPIGQLYDLARDPREESNVYLQHPEVARRLTELLERGRQAGERSSLTSDDTSTTATQNTNPAATSTSTSK